MDQPSIHCEQHSYYGHSCPDCLLDARRKIANLEVGLDAKQLDIIRLQEELDFQRKDAQRYHEAMTALKRSKMEHGLCEPVERHACTACAAIRTLERMASEYKGSRIILA